MNLFVSIWDAVMNLTGQSDIRNFIKVRKRAKIRNRYNQAPHMTQDTNGKVTTSQLDITNEIGCITYYSLMFFIVYALKDKYMRLQDE